LFIKLEVSRADHRQNIGKPLSGLFCHNRPIGRLSLAIGRLSSTICMVSGVIKKMKFKYFPRLFNMFTDFPRFFIVVFSVVWHFCKIY
jgi:hypothetical protein